MFHYNIDLHHYRFTDATNDTPYTDTTCAKCTLNFICKIYATDEQKNYLNRELYNKQVIL